MIVVDASNYTRRRLIPAVLDAWRAAGVGLVVVQAVDPPAAYPPSQTRQQILDCLDYGMPVAYYPFWWAGAGVDFLKRQLDLLNGFEGKLVTGLIDVEDSTVARRLRGLLGPLILPTQHLLRIRRQARPEVRLTATELSAPNLVDDIQSWLDVMAQFPTKLNRLGIYSAPWYFGPYLGNPTRFSEAGLLWWTSQYDNIVDANVVNGWGGFNAPADLKQYIGSTSLAGVDGIDLSVASDAFAQLIIGPVIDQRDKRIEDLQTALGDATGADGSVRTALVSAIKLSRGKQLTSSLRAIDGRLATIHKDFLEPGA